MLTALIAACGSDSPAAPPPATYPAVAVTYAISGEFDELTQAEANFAGTVSFTQASREASALTVTINLTVSIGGQAFMISLPVQAASVTAAKSLSFSITTES